MAGPQSKAPTLIDQLVAAGRKQCLIDDYYIAIIDGTGPFSEGTYEHLMHNSFCSQMYRTSEGHASYLRGPSADGIKMGVRADWAVAELENWGGDKRLMLAGYSRGASAAIMAAERLERLGKRVDSMFLFDPVARHMTEGGEVIPANVDSVSIIRRRLDRDIVERSSHIIPIGPTMLFGGTTGMATYGAASAYNYVQNPMRTWFGFTGTTYLGPKEHKDEVSFAGTHGAIGGVGTADVPEDRGVQDMCAKWMNARFAARRVPITLIAVPPTKR